MEIVDNLNIVNAIAGGVMIGLSSLILLLYRGDIAGINGMVKFLLFRISGSSKQRVWRSLFIISLISGSAISMYFLGTVDSVSPVSSFPLVIIGGFLVGVGATLGMGCTSGHGISGATRGSIRSLIAVPLFMTSGIVTVYFLKQMGFLVL